MIGIIGDYRLVEDMRYLGSVDESEIPRLLGIDEARLKEMTGPGKILPRGVNKTEEYKEISDLLLSIGEEEAAEKIYEMCECPECNFDD